MKVKLGEVADQIRGVTYKSQYVEETLSNNSIPLLRANNISNNGIINYDDVIYIKKNKIDSVQLIKQNDILVCASSGSVHLVGKAAQIKEDKLLSFGAFCKVIRPKNIHAIYLGYFFQSPYYRKTISSLAQGANINNIRNDDIDNLMINIYDDVATQEIVSILDKITSLISMRKEQLGKLDVLVKSKFIEMFGDPYINSKGFVKAPMGNYITVLTDFSANGSYKKLDSNVKMTDTPEYAWMVRTIDLESGNMDSIKYIDKKAYELLSKSKIFGGEIIMNKIGSAGKVYLMPEISFPASLGRNAFLFRYDERINVKYLYHLLISKYGTSEIQRYVQGAVTKTITKDSVRAIEIIVPDIDLQNQFAEFVEHVEKNKEKIKSSLNQLEILYSALMQEYFG